MNPFARIRTAVHHWQSWRHANALKPLIQRPLPYLALMAASSSFVVMLGAPMLNGATNSYANKVFMTAPWPVSLTLGLYLLAWCSIVGMAALAALSHSRALADRLFNPPQANT